MAVAAAGAELAAWECLPASFKLNDRQILVHEKKERVGSKKGPDEGTT